MIFFLISIFYVISCDAIANIGETRKIGRPWAFIFSFLLTPVLGWAITSLSKELSEDEIDSEIVYKEILKIKRGDLFTISFPRIISTIIAVNVMMFGFEVLLDAKGVISIMSPLTLYLGSKFHLWQLVTHQFIHGSVNHLYGNMIMLLMAGPSVEKRYGTEKTLLGYLLFGIVGGLIQMYMNGGGENMAGASGAVFGMLTIFAIIDNSHYLRFKWLKVRYFAIAIIIFELFSLKNAGDGIGHWAHFGGILAGLIFYLTQIKDGKEA